MPPEDAVMNPWAAVRGTLRRRRALRTCVLGPGAVVYEPERVVSVDGDRQRIRIGANTHVRGEILALPGGMVRIGEYCYLGEGSRVWAQSSVSVGDRVLIAHQVTILDSLTHPLDAGERHRHFATIISRGHPADVDLDARPVIVEDDAWIGCHCVILRGVRIGAQAIVGAGSVVTSDVPAHSIVAGNPARVVRTLAASTTGRIARGRE
jgi:acetyltransferase-like isoleucine patch superfamily enzyme